MSMKPTNTTEQAQAKQAAQLQEPPAWQVMERTQVRRERWPGGNRKAVSLVYPGQEVQQDQPIMRLMRLGLAREMSPRGATPLPDMPNEGEGGRSSGRVKRPDPFGEETIPAGLRGRVIDVTSRGGAIIESRVAAIRGAVGAGQQVAGQLTLWQPTGPTQQQPLIPPGAILVIPGPLTFAVLRYALSSGVSGVVASSIMARDLEGFLRADLLKLIVSVDCETAQGSLPRLTVLLTEGLGTLTMPVRTLNLLNTYLGQIALLSGATSVRQGIWPELLISLPASEAGNGGGDWRPTQVEMALDVGAQVRMYGGAHDSQMGEIMYLYTHHQRLPSGVHARAASVRLEDGRQIIAPLASLERIG